MILGWLWHTPTAMSADARPTNTRRTAFVRGFWKGMAAPVMLFGSISLPAEARPLEFQPLPRRPVPESSDWSRVGQHLRAALKQYRSENG